MAITINGSGTITGASSFTTNATFGGSLATASRGISSASVPVGSIIQVLQTELTTVFSSSAVQTWTDITGLSVNITPTSSASKILIICDLKGSTSADNATSRVLRNSTPIHVGTGATGSITASSGHCFYTAATNGQAVAHMFIDSPATTSLTTYKLQFWLRSGSIYFNATYSNSNNNYNFNGASSITVMEIAQ